MTSTVPSTAPRATTLDVQVGGSGFDAGSRAIWALKGDTAYGTTKIKTNSTTFVSSSLLKANITIAADAPLEKFDVQVVTLSGRKGIGIELFTVTYEVLDIGAGDGSSTEAVNDKGQIVGNTDLRGAFLWENGTIQFLPVLPGMTSSRAEDINENGQVVGYSSRYDASTGTSTYQAFIWSAATGIQPLGGTLGGCCSLARSISDAGVVLGEAQLVNGSATHAVVWENGVMRDIHALAGGSTFPWDLSNTLIVVGQWNPSGGAFLWSSGGGMTPIAGLEGPDDIPIGVNDAGQVVGWYRKSLTSQPTAFLWQSGTITDLGTLGGSSSVAMAINNFGVIVGRSATTTRRASGEVHAFVWTAPTGMKDLGSLLNRSTAQAADLNDVGWIVGQTWLSTGQSRATLWKLK